MATFTSFVSEAYLKGFTPISANVDITEILPHLETVELMNSRELLGRELYEDLKTKFGNQTLNADEIYLVNLLKRGISYRATSEAMTYLSMKITAKGPQTLRGEFSDPVSLNNVKYVKEDLENKADYYDQRVVDYLCDNSEKFPLYNETDDLEGIESVNNTQFDSDIYLDDYDRRDDDFDIDKFLK